MHELQPDPIVCFTASCAVLGSCIRPAMSHADRHLVAHPFGANPSAFADGGRPSSRSAAATQLPQETVGRGHARGRATRPKVPGAAAEISRSAISENTRHIRRRSVQAGSLMETVQAYCRQRKIAPLHLDAHAVVHPETHAVLHAEGPSINE